MHALNNKPFINLGQPKSLFDQSLGLLARRLVDVPLKEPNGTLHDFVKKSWHIIEPGRQFIDGWHIGAICEHLEAVSRGEIYNLIVNIPPRHMKSTLVCVAWFCWTWTWKPDSRWIYASYSDKLSTRDSVKCRRVITSPWYQHYYGDVFQLTSDQNQKTRFENDKTGYRIATSVGGSGTGEGGEFLVVDDALKAKDANSDAAIDEANDWWDFTMSTRGNDPDKTARVIVGQRLKENDLPGHVLDQMLYEEGTPYELLCLPARYDGPNRCILPISGWSDPRTNPGELLWPERFTEGAVQRLERELGNEAAGQLQQRPTSAEGGIFQKSWWGIQSSNETTDDLLEPKNRYSLKGLDPIARWIFFDTAFKDKDSNDPSACSIFDLTADYRLALRFQWSAKINSALLPAEIETIAAKWLENDLLREVVIEDKGSGITSIQTLEMGSKEWLAKRIRGFEPTGSKEYRARLASIWCGRDCILLPYPDQVNKDWYSKFLDPDRGQLFVFPNSANDDLTDTFSMGIIYLENYLSIGWNARMHESEGLVTV